MNHTAPPATQSLLIELLVEELPPKALQKLGDAFAATLRAQLGAQDLLGANARASAYASPRRLAAHITDVLPRSPDKPLRQKLMPASVGLDAQGQPTPALCKKLAALGVQGALAEVVAALQREGTGAAQTLYYASTQRGVALAAGVQKALDAAIARLPVPKLMRYQLPDGWSSVHFARPAHALVVLYGAQVLCGVQVLGLHAGAATCGHRFEARAAPLVIEHADRYTEQLRTQGAVIASFAERRAEIARQLHAVAAQAPGAAQPMPDDALLDEVTALVERPNVLLCTFDAQFLAVPPECLILTMKANQKYFPLLDAQGQLTNRFLLVSNITPPDASAVVQGNERVVRARLRDAQFFFAQDRKRPLSTRVAALDAIVYHHQLGSQGARVQRVRAIARAIASQLGDAALGAAVDQAALLAKADLTCAMVGEFPELQGTMGRYYALAEGLPEAVADAIEDHYKPRFAGDSLPRAATGTVLALADKLETLTGLFGTGNQPSGERDPFALRRHALGIIRMLMEKALALDVDALLAAAQAAFSAPVQDARAALADFLYERLAGSLREQGYSAQEVDAVLALRPQRLAHIPQRLQAVRAFARLPEAAALAAANKRVGNILKKSAPPPGAPAPIKPALLLQAAEKTLHTALQTIAPQADAQFAAGQYSASLQTLAALRPDVDAFFASVMVNAEDPALRANRLALLSTLHQCMNRVADLARLA